METKNISVSKGDWVKIEGIGDTVSLENASVYSGVEVSVNSGTPAGIGHNLKPGVPLTINNLDGAGVFVRSLNEDAVLVVTK